VSLGHPANSRRRLEAGPQRQSGDQDSSAARDDGSFPVLHGLDDRTATAKLGSADQSHLVPVSPIRAFQRGFPAWAADLSVSFGVGLHHSPSSLAVVGRLSRFRGYLRGGCATITDARRGRNSFCGTQSNFESAPGDIALSPLA